MKNYKYLAIAAAATVLAACSNDENMPGNDPDSPVELRLTSGINVLSRAYTPTQETQIASGQTVSVWVNDATATTSWLYEANQLTADGSGGFTGGDAMYFPQTGSNVNIYAMHGTFTNAFTQGDAFPAGTSVPFEVATDQRAATDYQSSDLLYAVANDVDKSGAVNGKKEVTLEFYHMLSKLELAIEMGVGAPVLSSEADAVTLGTVSVTGNFVPSATADMTDQSARAAMLQASGSPSLQTLTLGSEVSDDFTDANIVYNEAIIIPQSMAGCVLTLKLADGGTMTYTIPQGSEIATFESGKKYQLKVTANLTGLEVKSTVEEWMSGGTTSGNATLQ